MDTFHGSYFHFCLELALETRVKALLTHSLWVHNIGHTHSLASIQESGLSDQRTLLQTKSCLKCQRWSPYKVKEAFSTPICARKQTNGSPSIDQGFSTGSCNRPVPPFLLAQNLSSKRIAPTDNMQPTTDDVKRSHQLLKG